ncbi:hypothetical protein HK104_000621 [Borealophlyctis nickersoniae]|nr:hypothetical protein HK104_000621 [Borealophlyctis nickersoniae]
MDSSEFPKDTIILHHLGEEPTHALPSPDPQRTPFQSPFVLKLESYLRLTKTPYKVNIVPRLTGAPKGKMPFISYNSDVVGDSSLIISYLNTKTLIQSPVDATLTPLQKAHSTAIKAIVEDRMYFTILYYRWGRDFEKYMYPTVLQVLPQPLRYILGYYVIAPNALKRCAGHGISHHSDEERVQFWKEDVDALAAYLGDKLYMLGDTPHAVDCCVFGFVYNVLAVKEVAPELREYVLSKGNLVEHSRRCLESWWPELVEAAERLGTFSS